MIFGAKSLENGIRERIPKKHGFRDGWTPFWVDFAVPLGSHGEAFFLINPLRLTAFLDFCVFLVSRMALVLIFAVFWRPGTLFCGIRGAYLKQNLVSTLVSCEQMILVMGEFRSAVSFTERPCRHKLSVKAQDVRLTAIYDYHVIDYERSGAAAAAAALLRLLNVQDL